MRVYVLDANDEAPQFSSPSYNVTISEGDKAGKDIVTVSADDKDLVSITRPRTRDTFKYSELLPHEPQFILSCFIVALWLAKRIGSITEADGIV